MLRNGLPDTLGSFLPLPRRPLCWALGHRAEGKARKTKCILMAEVAWVEGWGRVREGPPGRQCSGETKVTRKIQALRGLLQVEKQSKGPREGHRAR